MDNQFGKTSKLQWKALKKDEKTILRDIYFTAPYKIMNPFEHKDGSISVMLLTASAGVMAGDTSLFEFEIMPGAQIEFLSQSFEKIHRMEQGKASRKTRIEVASGGEFFYHPLPVIPFAGSAFENETEVFLEDEHARFDYYEILACGRSARQERFAYQKYRSKINIHKGGKLIYRDNTIYQPDLFPMESTGFYEGCTHLGTFIFCNSGKDAAWLEAVKELLKKEADIQGGATVLESGDYLIKILGYQAQKLQEVAHKIRFY